MRSLLAVVLVLSAQLAHADTVGVVVAGEATMQPRVAAQLQGWLEQHGFTYVAAPLDGDAQKTLLNCFVVEDMTCARGTFDKRSKADSLVFVRIELTGGGQHEMSLTGNWIVKDHDVFAEKRWCKQCDDAALHQTVDQLMTFLASATGIGKAHIEIHSKPEGAVVALDGVSIGVAPVAHDVTPGPHQITLMHGERSVGSKTIKVEPGATVEISVPVVDPGEPNRWPPIKIASIALAGGGAAALIAGGVFFYYGHKGGPDTPLIYPDATRDGVIATIVGAAAIGGGAYLWLRATHASSAPTASISPQGATLGWAGRF
jgi:hypothetical protein